MGETKDLKFAPFRLLDTPFGYGERFVEDSWENKACDLGNFFSVG